MDTVHSVLRHVKHLDALNEWIFSQIRPFLGKRILEAGCGNGNLTTFYLKHTDCVVAVDHDAVLIQEIRRRYSASHLYLYQKDLSGEISDLNAHRPDTVICLNTLEHIKNDQKTLKNFYHLLPPQGKMILQVPAFPFLYGSVDQAVGHYRRYQRKDLIATVQAIGFEVKICNYFNIFGILGWFWNGKIIRRPYLSLSLLSLFNFLLPLFKSIEKFLGPPFGLSLILVAEKK